MSLYTSNPDVCKHTDRIRTLPPDIPTERCEGCGLVRNMEWAPWRNPTKQDLKDMPLETDSKTS